MGEQSKTISLSKIKSKLLKMKDMADNLINELMNLPDELPINQNSKIMAKKKNFDPPVRKNAAGMRSMQRTALNNISPGMLKPKGKKKK